MCFVQFEASMGASAGNKLFSLFTLFIYGDIMEGHFRQILLLFILL